MFVANKPVIDPTNNIQQKTRWKKKQIILKTVSCQFEDRSSITYPFVTFHILFVRSFVRIQSKIVTNGTKDSNNTTNENDSGSVWIPHSALLFDILLLQTSNSSSIKLNVTFNYSVENYKFRIVEMLKSTVNIGIEYSYAWIETSASFTVQCLNWFWNWETKRNEMKWKHTI